MSEWLNLLVRWFHVVAGVFWIGQTAFFSWLDTRMRIEADPETGEKVWMVHSGGFYRVEKLKAPETMPRLLHWFRWEAAFSWMSGIFLLVLVYYFGGILVDPDSGLPFAAAAWVAAASLIVGWIVYDLLWISPLAARNELATEFLSLLLIVAAAYGYSQILSSRAAYIHLGALLGTVMAANVWARILPAQRHMVAAVKAGEKPDLTLGERAKQRSKHNTFMALPVIFIMISNHYPTASYGHRLGWILLLAFVALGFFGRWILNRWEAKA